MTSSKAEGNVKEKIIEKKMMKEKIYKTPKILEKQVIIHFYSIL